MVMIGDFLATMSLYIPYTHSPDMAVARGVEPRNAAFLISAAGICSTIGRVLAGLLCDQRKLHPMTITCMATGFAALQAFLLIRYGTIFFLLFKNLLDVIFQLYAILDVLDPHLWVWLGDRILGCV